MGVLVNSPISHRKTAAIEKVAKSINFTTRCQIKLLEVGIIVSKLIVVRRVILISFYVMSGRVITLMRGVGLE